MERLLTSLFAERIAFVTEALQRREERSEMRQA